MFRQEMPRVYELRDLIDDLSESGAYFQDFDSSISDDPSKQKTWLARERVFQRLDPESWQFLKSEAKPYLTKRSASGRGHQQLIAILNQAWAHNYLIDEGCLQVRFIPRARKGGRETPDLEGELQGRKVLCEVKTVSISDDEVARQQTGGAGSTAVSLEVGFFNKLNSDLLKAKKQIKSYDNSAGARHIVFMVVDFDDFLGEYKANYFQQIDRHLATNPIHGIDIVFYNQRTAFHFPVAMCRATVVNEPG